jgi:hypothetical protein
MKLAKLKKVAVNNFPQYTQKLEEIAYQLEDIYDLVKKGGPVYKMGQECDEQLQGWYNNLGSMAENVEEAVRDVLSISNRLLDYSGDIEGASEAYNYKETE